MTLRSATPKEAACMEQLKLHESALMAELEADDVHFLNESTWLRFTRARDADAEKALCMLTACCKWRKQFLPHRITQEDVIDILGLGTCFCSGVCRKQRPILVMMPGAANPRKWEVEGKMTRAKRHEKSFCTYCRSFIQSV